MYDDYSGNGEFMLALMAVAASGALLLSLMPWRRTRRALAKIWLALPLLLATIAWFEAQFLTKDLESWVPLVVVVTGVLLFSLVWSLPALGTYALLRFAINKMKIHTAS